MFFLLFTFLRKVNFKIRVSPKNLESEENHRAESEIHQVAVKTRRLPCVLSGPGTGVPAAPRASRRVGGSARSASWARLQTSPRPVLVSPVPLRKPRCYVSGIYGYLLTLLLPYFCSNVLFLLHSSPRDSGDTRCTFFSHTHVSFLLLPHQGIFQDFAEK